MFGVLTEASEEDWQDKPGRHWRSSAGMGAQTGRQEDQARIPKCASIVFQDILSSPLRKRHGGRSLQRAAVGGAGESERCCHVVSNDSASEKRGSNALWFDSPLQLSAREAPESKLNVVQHANAQQCQQKWGRGREGWRWGCGYPWGRQLCSLLISNLHRQESLLIDLHQFAAYPK